VAHTAAPRGGGTLKRWSISLLRDAMRPHKLIACRLRGQSAKSSDRARPFPAAVSAWPRAPPQAAPRSPTAQPPPQAAAPPPTQSPPPRPAPLAPVARRRSKRPTIRPPRHEAHRYATMRPPDGRPDVADRCVALRFVPPSAPSNPVGDALGTEQGSNRCRALDAVATAALRVDRGELERPGEKRFQRLSAFGGIPVEQTPKVCQPGSCFLLEAADLET
jgi:hypothetical protein